MGLIGKILRFIWALWGMVVFLVSLIIVTPIYFIIFGIGGDKNSLVAHKISRSWARFLLTFFGVRIKIHNAEKLDPEQTYVFISNHASQFDIPAWRLATNHFFKFLAKEELTKIPLLGFIIRHLCLTVNRKDPKARAESFEFMQDSLQNGNSVVIFPEGSRNRTQEPLMRFYDGAFQLGIQSGYPIAVLTIKGSWDILEADSLFQMSPGTIHCYWEGILQTEDLSYEAINELKTEAKNLMESRLISDSSK